MFGSLGKQFAGDIASQLQKRLGDHLSKKSREKGGTEEATESLGQVSRRKALFIGINYYGQNGALVWYIMQDHTICKTTPLLLAELNREAKTGTIRPNQDESCTQTETEITENIKPLDV